MLHPSIFMCILESNSSFSLPFELGVKRKVDKALSAFRAWTDMTFGLEIPVKVIGLALRALLKKFRYRFLPFPC